MPMAGFRMQVNGQWNVQTPAVRWSSRLLRPFQRYGKVPTQRYRAAHPGLIESGLDMVLTHSHMPSKIRPDHSANHDPGAAYLKSQCTILLLILLIHAGTLYLLTRLTD